MRLLIWVGFILLLAVLLFFFVGALNDNFTRVTVDGDTAIIVDEEQLGEDIEEFAETSVEIAQNIATQTLDAAQNIWNRLLVVPQNNLIRVLMVIGGAILLLAGWRVYDEIVLLAGIFTGAVIAVSLVPQGDTLLEIAALLIGGLIGAVLAVFLFYVAVFFIGAYVGLILTNGLVDMMGVAPASSLVLLLGALIGGVLLLGLSSQLLILVSALVGAQLLVLALGLPTYWIILLTIIGVVIQILLAGRYGVPIYRRPRRPVYLSRLRI